MVGVLTTAGKDLRRYMRDRLAALMWLGIPLVIGSLMILATGGSEGPTIQAHVLVADEDDTFLSRLLLGAMGQGRAGDIIQAERVDQHAGRQRLDRGEATALLVIPKGFSEALLKEEPTRLLLVVNPAQRILPGIVEELLRMVADGAFYVHRLVGPELRAMATGPTGGRKTFSTSRSCERPPPSIRPCASWSGTSSRRPSSCAPPSTSPPRPTRRPSSRPRCCSCRGSS